MRLFLLCALFGASASVLFAAPPPDAPAAKREPATIRVALPADAQLTVDGYLTRSTSSERVLQSPPLEPGKDYRYTLKAEFVRAGQTITIQQTVLVRAGRESTVALGVPREGSARSGAAYAYGAGSPETSAFYYPAESPPPAAATPAPRYVRPESTPGLTYPERPRFPRYGTDPSDPFYHSGQ